MAKIQCCLIIALVCVEIQSMNSKRSLISRFTSNPFFLSAFDEYREFPEYPPPANHESDNRVTFFEKYKITEPHRGFFDYSDTSVKSEKSPNFHLSSEDHNEDNSEEIEHLSHDEDEDEAPFLHAQESQEFAPHHEDNSEEISGNLHVTQYNITDIDTTVKFNQLPHFEQNHQYLPPQKVAEIQLNLSGGKFNQLPHYGKIDDYLPLSAQKLSETRLNSGSATVKFNKLPHLPPQKFADTPHNSDDIEIIEEDTPQFNQLPHYDKIKEFLPPQKFSDTRSNSSNIEDDEPKFNQLPHYDQIKEYLPFKQAQESSDAVILENFSSSQYISDIGNNGKIPEKLPHRNSNLKPSKLQSETIFEVDQNVKQLNNRSELPEKIEQIEPSEPDSESVELFKSVPLYEIHEIFWSNSTNPTNRQRKFTPRRKNKTGLPTTERLEFRNLPQFASNQSFKQPKFRNIAEIPLEDNFDKDKLRVNSYGDKLK